jgi:hypothetical protein
MPKPNIDPKKLRRTNRDEEPDETPEEPRVSNPVDRVIDLAFNPTREKIREVTIVDRVQGRLFPQLDMINYMRKYCLEIAHYRQDADQYKKTFKKVRPIPPEPLDEFLYRTAQWQKSVAGKNLDRATDIALAETETKGLDGDEFSDRNDAWKD